MILGMCLGIQQCSSVHHIVLNMIAFQTVEEGADHHFQLFQILLGGEHGRGNLLVQQHTTGNLMGGQFGNRLEHSGGAIFVHCVGRRAALCQRLTSQTAIGSCHGAVALAYVGGDGRGAAIADTADGAPPMAGIGILLHLIEIGIVSLYHQQVDFILVIAVAGLPAIMESEGFDRWVMKLPKCQNILIEQVCTVQPNTIVVLQNGGTVEMPWAERPKAILEAYLGGEAVSEAIWDVLTGINAPSGHLAETFPLRLEDNPCYLSWPGEGDHVPYTEGVFVGYRYYSSKAMPVLFPFGHGLTYTDFSYSDLELSRETFSSGEMLTASVTVTNTGKRSSKALVQLYVAPERNSQIKRPVCELRDFQKVLLQPGESKVVSFTLDARAFAHRTCNSVSDRRAPPNHSQ